jgi:hypothetical protein
LVRAAVIFMGDFHGCIVRALLNVQARMHPAPHQSSCA